MRCLPQSSAIASFCTVVLFLASGCGASKVAQCNSVIEIANSAVEEARNLTNEGDTSEPQDMLQAADAMEEASRNMQALELKDETLQQYRTGFIQMYNETSTATRTFVDAFEKKDRPAAEAALAELQRATQPEQELVNSINGYCQGTN